MNEMTSFWILQSHNPEREAAGAIAAAKKYARKSIDIKVLGYTFLEDPFMTSPQRQRIKRQENYEIALYRKDFLLYDSNEVRKAIFETLLDEQFSHDIPGK